MKSGILILNKSGDDLPLPIFCEDRELVVAVLKEAMQKYKKRKLQRFGAAEFYEIADTLLRKRTKSACFIGPEGVWGCFLKNALYVFRVDLENQRIIPLENHEIDE